MNKGIVNLDNYFRLKLSFTYTGRLATPERQPIIYWWSSTIRSSDRGTQWTPINTWEDKEKQISTLHHVEIPIDTSRKLRIDDCIWAQCLVQAPNEDGKLVGQRAGVSSVYLIMLVVQSARAKGQFEQNLELRLPTYMDRGQQYVKGCLNIKIHNTPEELSSLKFEDEPGKYELVQGNYQKIRQILDESVGSMYSVFDDSAKKLGTYFSAVEERLEGIQAPYWVDVLTVPGLFYWIDYSDYDPDESFMENLSRIALDRYDITEDEFVEIVEEQFKQDDDNYDDRFTVCVVAMVAMITIPAISLYYKSDETYLSNDGNSLTKEIIRKTIESFNDALQLLGGDCEDLAAYIHRIARMLEMGVPKHKDESKPWKKNGGWKTKLLDCMQRICHIYVGAGSLGSVTASKIGDEDEKPRPLIIDSVEDIKANIGGHMWYEMIPLVLFEHYMKKTNKDHPFKTYPNETKKKWESKLPHLVAEGTGSVFPMLMPLQEYYTDDKKKKEIRESHVKKLNMYRYVLGCTKYFRYGQYERMPTMVDDVSDARYSFFYRQTSSIFTDKFIREGYDIGHFMWTYLSPRQQEEPRSEQHAENRRKNDLLQARKKVVLDDKDQSQDTKWKWGVNMRDKLTGKQDVGLVTFPGFLEEEKEVVKTILRQFAPLYNPRLTEEQQRKIKADKQSHIDAFQQMCNDITRGRKENASTIQKMYIVFRGQEFFAGKISEGERQKRTLQEVLLEDIRENDRIVRCRTVLEIITDRNYNVRIDLFVNTPTETEINEILSLKKSKNGGHHSDISSYFVDQSINTSLITLRVQWTPNTRQSSLLEEKEEFRFRTSQQCIAFENGIKYLDPTEHMSMSELNMYVKGRKLAESRKGYTVDTLVVE